MRLLFALLVVVGLGLSAGVSLAEDKHIAPTTTKDSKPAHPEGPEPVMSWHTDTGVWTLVVFGLLLVILKKSAWEPILEGLKKREESIHFAVNEAKKLREDNAKAEASFKAELQEAYTKIPAMMEEARRDAAELKEQIRTEGNAEVQKERQRLLREIDIARDQALQDIWTQAAQVATLISSKAVGRSLNADDHRRLVDEALGELKQKVN